MKTSALKFLLFCTLFFHLHLIGTCCAKFDLGATFIDVDFLTSGRTQESDHMVGYRGDATLRLIGGVVLKPSFIVAEGDNGKLATGSIGLGHCTPIFKGFMLIPSAGVAFSYLKTKIDFTPPGFNITFYDQKERFRSVSPYLALEFCYTYCKWTLMGGYQYAWSRTHTKISNIVSDTSECSGSNYTLGIEYAINRYWAVNLGAGYNVSLSKEKHGVRAKGMKLGIAYYY